jgi:bifunctional non-homologous end joining protein LigD
LIEPAPSTGFSEKLLKILSLELNKIAVKFCPFFNLPATGRGLDPGLTVAEMKRCIWVKPSMVCEVKFTEWTRDDRLRQPVFLGIREDKSERGHTGEGKLGNLSRSLIASRP